MIWTLKKDINHELEQFNYKAATKLVKIGIQKTEDIEEVKNFLVKNMLFLNLTGNKNKKQLFCNRIMTFALEKLPELKNYTKQCKVLNEEFDKQGEVFENFVKNLYEYSSFEALHILLGVFENTNQLILLNQPEKETEKTFFNIFSYNREAIYESNVQSFNQLLKIWKKEKDNNRFKKHPHNISNLNEQYTEKIQTLYPALQNLNFLRWTANQVTLHTVDMEINSDSVKFVIKNKEEFIKFQLPIIRLSTHLQSFAFEFFEQHPDFFENEATIDYENIIIPKSNSNDYSLKYGIETIKKAFSQAIPNILSGYTLISQDMHIKDMSGIFIKQIEIEKIYFFYHAIRIYAEIYFYSNRYYTKKYETLPRAPYMGANLDDFKEKIKFIMDIILQFFKKNELQSNELETLIKILTYGNEDIFDLYYKPLIVEENTVYMIPSIFLMNNISRNFIHHMNDLGAHFTEKGDEFEEDIRTLFSDNGFEVYFDKYEYSYVDGDEKIDGDIDLIAQKGNFLYIGEAKNKIEPIEPEHYRGVDKSIKQGTKQALKSKKYVEKNLKEFSEKIGIDENKIKSSTIVPFVILSCFYGSGDSNNKIPIIDSSALDRFMSIGKIKAHTFNDQEVYEKNIRTQGDIIPEQFNEFLENPYFLDPYVYGPQYGGQHFAKIDERMFIVEPSKDWRKDLNDSFLDDALNHFQENEQIPTISQYTDNS